MQRAGLHPALDLSQVTLGARKQFSARAGAVGGHQRAAADDQPLAGIQLSQAISARLSSSNTDNCKAPSLTSFLTCGAFSAVMNANSAVSEKQCHILRGADPAISYHDHTGEPEPLLELSHL